MLYKMKGGGCSPQKHLFESSAAFPGFDIVSPDDEDVSMRMNRWWETQELISSYLDASQNVTRTMRGQTPSRQQQEAVSQLCCVTNTSLSTNMNHDKQEHHGDEHQHSTATLYKDSSIRSPREEVEMEDNLLLLLHPKHSCSYLGNKKIQQIVKMEKEDKSPAIIGLPLVEENYQPQRTRQSAPTISSSKMIGGESKTPFIVILPLLPPGGRTANSTVFDFLVFDRPDLLLLC